MSTITIRQTRDPYAANIEYIAWCKMSLESNGDLNMKGIGVGMPGDRFAVRSPQDNWFHLPEETVPVRHLHFYMWNTELGPLMTVVELNDSFAAQNRYYQKLAAERHAEQIEDLKASFIRAYKWITSPFRIAEKRHGRNPTAE